MQRFAILAMALTLAGCAGMHGADQLGLEVMSDPPGAQIYFDEGAGDMKLYGFAPQTVLYRPTPAQRQAGSMATTAISARWASGATQTVSSVNLPVDGTDRTYTIKRPANVPGIDKDFQFAVKLEQLRQQQEANDDAAAARTAAILFSTPTRCTTTMFGQVATTNCN